MRGKAHQQAVGSIAVEQLGHRVNNPASCRGATAAGYRDDGIKREKLRDGNTHYDVETHARLASDPAPDVPMVVPVTG